jgi:hypothetical protein
MINKKKTGIWSEYEEIRERRVRFKERIGGIGVWWRIGIGKIEKRVYGEIGIGVG